MDEIHEKQLGHDPGTGKRSWKHAHGKEKKEEKDYLEPLSGEFVVKVVDGVDVHCDLHFSVDIPPEQRLKDLETVMSWLEEEPLTYDVEAKKLVDRNDFTAEEIREKMDKKELEEYATVDVDLTVAEEKEKERRVYTPGDAIVTWHHILKLLPDYPSCLSVLLEEKLEAINGQASRVKAYEWKDKEGLTALHHSAKCGMNSAITAIADALEEAEFAKACTIADKTGNLPLHYAVKSDEVETTRILMNLMKELPDESFAPNTCETWIKESIINEVDQEKGHTPLMMAVKEGNEKIVKLLVEKKADMDMRAEDFDDQMTALMMAVESNKKVQDPDVETKSFITMAELLLRLGASPWVKDGNGFHRALHYAQRGTGTWSKMDPTGYENMISLIENKEAELDPSGSLRAAADTVPEAAGCLGLDMNNPHIKKMKQKCVIQ
jgi:ankyrin repeat protein